MMEEEEQHMIGQNNEKIEEVNESEYGSESNWIISKTFHPSFISKLTQNIDQWQKENLIEAYQ